MIQIGFYDKPDTENSVHLIMIDDKSEYWYIFALKMHYLRCFDVLRRLLLGPADDIAGGTSTAVFLRLCMNTVLASCCCCLPATMGSE